MGFLFRREMPLHNSNVNKLLFLQQLVRFFENSLEGNGREGTRPLHFWWAALQWGCPECPLFSFYSFNN